MKTAFRVALLVVLAVELFGAYRYGEAQEPQSANGRTAVHFPTFDVQIPPDVKIALKHVLQATYNNSGDFQNLVGPETYTPIDTPVAFVCPGTTGTCTIQVDFWLENGAASNSDNFNVVCIYLDGAAIPQCEFTSGLTPSDASFAEATTSVTVSGLAPGTHYAQTYFWSRYGALVDYFDSNYRIYKP